MELLMNTKIQHFHGSFSRFQHNFFSLPFQEKIFPNLINLTKVFYIFFPPWNIEILNLLIVLKDY